MATPSRDMYTLPRRRWFVLFLFLLGLVSCSTSANAAEEPKPLKTESVSSAHTLFSQQCDLCHEKYQGVPDKRCLTCHVEPPHNEVQAFTPPCRSCHQEHQGKERLARVTNEQCVTCHSDLPVKENRPVKFATKVTDFAHDHPEFSFTIPEATNPQRVLLDVAGAEKDHTTLTFPHNTHLGFCPDTGKPCLKGPKGLVKLECKNCHAPSADGISMKPVTYSAGCQQVCHPLKFDPRYPDQVVPHDFPRNIRAFLFLTFSERREAPPPPPVPESSGRLTRSVPPTASPSPASGLAQRVDAAERYIYQDGTVCDKCHIVDKKRRDLPQIADPMIPEIWFPHAQFAHKAHRMLECTSCHQGVTKSGKAKDVLLPKIEVCRECHRATQEEAVQRHPTASTECVTCHKYHQKAEPRDWNGPFTIQRVLTEGVPDKAKGAAPRAGQP